MFGGATRPVQVRPLVEEDAGAVIDLMRRQEFAQEHAAETLRRLFDYGWEADRKDHGFVLDSEGRIVGFLLAAYSRRVMEGDVHRVCNVGAWYVDPDYRLQGALLVKALMGLRDHTLIGLTANPRASAVLERLGFQVHSRNRLYFGPLAALSSWRGTAVELLDGPEAIEGLLTAEHRRIVQDHRPYGCRPYLLRQGARYCLVVTKRRPLKGLSFLPAWIPHLVRKRWYPVSDLLYVSDPEVAREGWGRLQRRILRREATLGVTVDEAFLGFDAPAALKMPHPVHAYRCGMDVARLGALYTEIVLLPI